VFYSHKAPIFNLLINVNGYCFTDFLGLAEGKGETKGTAFAFLTFEY
jgi:hypothetical protein